MRINILQHTPNERPGLIKTWARMNHHEIFIYHPQQFHIFPEINETDFLIILGGPMSVNDPLPWLASERRLIKAALKKQIPVLGICLGAQQISKALGAKVISGQAKEVGWAPIYLKEQLIAGLPEKLDVLHWHGEVFELPAQAKLLFSSKLTQNQAFVYHQNVVGLQFHLEPAADNLREIVINDQAYIKGSALKQTAAEILAHQVPEQNKTAMFTILDYLAANK